MSQTCRRSNLRERQHLAQSGRSRHVRARRQNGHAAPSGWSRFWPGAVIELHQTGL